LLSHDWPTEQSTARGLGQYTWRTRLYAPQSCAFRDHYQALAQLAQVFGLSTQSTQYQQEAATRLHLPFQLLSDFNLEFSDALKLPTFTINSMRLNKRLTLIAFDGLIKHCFYPVFPPNKNAEEALDWLKQNV
jgi:peroxiredoxin